MPDLVEHIRTQVRPGWGGDHVHVKGSRTPPAPIRLAAVDDADQLHAMVAGWCEQVMDGRDLAGPDWAGTMVLPASRRARASGRHGRSCRRCACFGDAAPRPVGPHRPGCSDQPCDGCVAAYDAPRAYGLRRPGATQTLVRWLIPHLDWLLAGPAAAEFVAEVTAAVRSAQAHWPVEERPVRCAAPCPACDRLTLVRRAPRWQGGPVTISCEAADCGEPLDEGLYAHYVRVVLAS